LQNKLESTPKSHPMNDFYKKLKLILSTNQEITNSSASQRTKSTFLAFSEQSKALLNIA